MAAIFLILATIISFTKSATFSHSDTLNSVDVDVAIEIGDTQTAVTVTLPLDEVGPSWAIGFGGTNMDGTYAVILTVETSITGASVSATEVTLSSYRTKTEISGADNWSTSASINGQNVVVTLTRDNTVSCTGCYDFDPLATTLGIIYARGSDESFSGHSGTNRGFATLTAAATTTTSPPSNIFTYDTTLDGDDFSIKIEITEIDTTVTIIALTTDTNPYAIGFGGLDMDGTYAVILAQSGNSIGATEVTLSSARSFTAISGADNWTPSLNIDAINQKITIGLTRDNSVGCAECYPFDPTATSLDIVYAKSSGSSSFTTHTMANRNGVTLTVQEPTDEPTTAMPTTAAPTTAAPTTAAPTEDGTDPDSSANNIFEVFYIGLIVGLSCYFMA